METEDVLDVVDHDKDLARQVTTEHEVEAIHHLEARLYRSFPTLPPVWIDEVVESRYHQFDDCRIRDYVPILVEHAAKNQLLRSARG